MHSIDYGVVHAEVLADMQRYAVLAIEDEKKLVDRILKDNNDFKDKSVSRYQRTIRESKNRVKQLDGFLASLFEEKLQGNVSDMQFKRLAQNYKDEQTKLMADISTMEIELEECQRIQHDLGAWIERVKECITIDSLTRQIVVELIDRIEVSETYTVDGQPTIDLHIAYRFGVSSSVG